MAVRFINRDELYFVGADNKKTSAAAFSDTPVTLFLGDSHVSAFASRSGVVPRYPAIVQSTVGNMWVCRIGSALAVNLERQNSSTRGGPRSMHVLASVPAGSTIFLCFGEIDCRIHIIRRANHNETEIITQTELVVAAYFRFVDAFRQKAKQRGINVGIISPPPTWSSPLEGNAAKVSAFMTAKKFHSAKRILAKLGRRFLPKKSPIRYAIEAGREYAGTPQLRNVALSEMTKGFRLEAAQREIAFIDMYTPFIGADGLAERRFFFEDIHLDSEAITQLADQFSANGITFAQQ